MTDEQIRAALQVDLIAALTHVREAPALTAPRSELAEWMSKAATLFTRVLNGIWQENKALRQRVDDLEERLADESEAHADELHDFKCRMEPQ